MDGYVECGRRMVEPVALGVGAESRFASRDLVQKLRLFGLLSKALVESSCRAWKRLQSVDKSLRQEFAIVRLIVNNLRGLFLESLG